MKSDQLNCLPQLASQILNFEPEFLHDKLYTLNLQPRTLNPKLQIPTPKPQPNRYCESAGVRGVDTHAEG